MLFSRRVRQRSSGRNPGKTIRKNTSNCCGSIKGLSQALDFAAFGYEPAEKQLVDPSSGFTGSGGELISREYLIRRMDQYLQILELKAGIEVSDKLENGADLILTSIDWLETEILEIRHFESAVGCEHGCSLFRVSE